MHRTQICLQDDVYASLKVRPRSLSVSVSELTRRTLEKDIQKDPVADMQAFFERLKPMESFAGVDSEDYVRAIRGKSRILRSAEKA